MTQNVAAFVAAATLLTITPGLDTALVVRTAASEGSRQAALAGAGIVAGLFTWGVLVALGLGVVLAASEVAYAVLKSIGAAYLVYLGVQLILRPRNAYDLTEEPSARRQRRSWLLRGLLSNLLNPKVGVFYVSFLPQFIPPDVRVGVFSILLSAIHAIISVLWFAVLISATAPLARALRSPRIVRGLDRMVGAVFVGFGVRLALSARR